MKINNNIQALNAYRNLNQNQQNVSKNLEKLSSGLRINRASDDAAGLAISEKMRSQIRGLKQAERNAMDGISLIQTSEGAMQEVHSILQRMKELAVQASNDTNTEYDREQIQKEMDALTEEIDSISEKTEFNSKKLLDGSSALFSRFVSEDANGANLASVPYPVESDAKSGEYRLEILSKPGNIQVESDNTEIVQGLDTEKHISDKLGEYKVKVDVDEEGVNKTVTVYDPDGELLEEKTTEQDSIKVAGFLIGLEGLNDSIEVEAKVQTQTEVKLTINGNTQTKTLPIMKGSFNDDRSFKEGTFILEGVSFEINNEIKQNKVSEFEIANNPLAFQIGPNAGQQVMVDVPKLDSKELKLEGINVLSHETASKAMEKIDLAINTVSDARANLGAVQNRLEHTINNLQVTHENLTSSESRIRDADMALEMTEFTRNNIINQSATAMLAQANQLPQGVLQLLQ